MHSWEIRGRSLTIASRPLIMGIVNATPDSFSDGGQYVTAEAAIAHGLELVRQGADLLDIGGESTRPGALPVPVDEEIRRVRPVVAALARQTAVPLSIDTSKAAVAQTCLEAGAHIVNDVTALTGDPAMVEVVSGAQAGAIVMHMRGTPASMQLAPQYGDVVAEVDQYLETRLLQLTACGIAAQRLVLDPGIGFGKTTEHNVALLRHLHCLQRHGRPVCLGVSRKGLFGRLLGRPVEGRLPGSLATVCFVMTRGAVQIVRTHDVEATRDAVIAMSLLSEGAAQPPG